MNTYQFANVQGGYWGQQRLGKVLSIKAESEYAARMIVQARKDFWKKLRSGDHITWIMLDSTKKSC